MITAALALRFVGECLSIGAFLLALTVWCGVMAGTL
jgi:hypothetical protein